MSASIDAIWQNDLLGRKSDALFLIDFLVAKVAERDGHGAKRSFVLNIDAGWGHGKSYFLSKMQETLTAKGFVIAHVNAWNDDHADDPLIAVMAAIDVSVKSNASLGKSAEKSLGKLAQIGGRVVAAGAKGLLKQAASKYLGDEAIEHLSELVGTSASEAVGSVEKEIGKQLDELYDAEGKALLEKFNRGKKSIAEFKAQLGKVLESFKSKSKLPLFVLVDELDRCRPPYAVTLLERVKHLFDVNDVVFVLATDTSQLLHSIKALYGADFNAGRYLHRFFDQTYRFQAPSVRDFVATQFSNIEQKKLLSTPNLTAAEFVADAFATFQLSLRDIEQCVDVLSNCVTVWSAPCPIVLIVLIPLVVAQQQRIVPKFSDHFGGELANTLGHSGHLSGWKLDFNIFENRKKTIVEGWKFFERIVSAATSENLRNIVDRGDGKQSAEDRMITNILSEELTLRFSAGYPANNPPVSLIRGYPELVRSVGRLAPT